MALIRTVGQAWGLIRAGSYGGAFVEGAPAAPFLSPNFGVLVIVGFLGSMLKFEGRNGT